MTIHSKSRLDHLLGEVAATKEQRNKAYLSYALGLEEEVLEILGLALPTEAELTGEPEELSPEEAEELGVEEIEQPDGATAEEVEREWLGQWGDREGDEWKHQD